MFSLEQLQAVGGEQWEQGQSTVIICSKSEINVFVTFDPCNKITFLCCLFLAGFAFKI